MSRRLRGMCVPSQVKKITQGTIFSDAACNDRSYKNVVGVVISARCDIDNFKDDSFAYLPAVPLLQWIEKACMPKAIEEILATKRRQYLDSAAKLPGISPIIGVLSIDKIHEYILKASNGKVLSEFVKLHDEIEEINALGAVSYSKLDVTKKLHKSIRSIINKEVDKCAKNQIGGAFLVDRVVDFSFKEDFSAYVINLREVRYLPAWLGKELAAGFFHDPHIGNGEVSSCINLSAGGFSYALCDIKSPYIELIMQRFTSLFSRIGVEDPVVDEIISTVK